MVVDKNLFLYDLAFVSIMKCEGPYVKEWLDYHLLAGVNHFYIYDNESPDNLKEVLQPYINAGIVTYKFYPGKKMQMQAFNEALKNYKFYCRYMAFIDGDEFVFPQTGKSIVETVDEILKDKPTAGGLEMQWLMFGSNYQDKADYSRGVLERFTRSSTNPERSLKTIANPRKVNYLHTPHYMNYFDGFFQINEVTLKWFQNVDYTVYDKIRVNHYARKSKEEFANKNPRGDVAFGTDTLYPLESFSHENFNDVLDDSILKYVKLRQDAISHGGGGGKKGAILYQINYRRLYISLLQNLSPTFAKNTPQEFYSGKLETFLTCFKLAGYLRKTVLDKNAANFFEESALNAVYRSMWINGSIADAKLLLGELPEILKLDYSVVKNIIKLCMEILKQMKDILRENIDKPEKLMFWRDFVEYDYLMEMLKTFDAYKK